VNWQEWVISDPAVMMGKPVIVGTRITVELILEKLAADETIEQIVEAHPRLTKEAIQAALAFAAQVLRAGVVYSVWSPYNSYGAAQQMLELLQADKQKDQD
jgi:uncharacterized protein (DUF433 family)